MSDTADPDELANKIAAAVAKASRIDTPISHGVARVIAERYLPEGRAPQGRAVFRKALAAFIASGVMRSVNTTPPRWAPHPSADLPPAQSLFTAASSEGQWDLGSDADKDALAAFGDYLQARQAADEVGAVPDWRDHPIE